MALSRMRFYSDTLKAETELCVLLPDPRPGVPYGPLPVLYLLHGMGGSADSWLRGSGIERYAKKYGLAVILPDTGNSACCDMHCGGRYFTCLTEELPFFAAALFPITRDRKKTLIAGCSMGGYGALKLGFARPDLYGCIGSFSAGYQSYAPYVTRKDARGVSLQDGIFGSDQARLLDDARTAANMQKLADDPEPPKLYLSCGTEDSALLENTRATEQLLRDTRYPFTYTEKTGRHDWDFWDGEIRSFLDFAAKEECL